MEIKLTLALPRDELSVPVVRRTLAASLDILGVDADVIGDIEVALTEACTNVLDHSDGTQEYEVSVGISGSACIIEVVDRGAEPFDGAVQGLHDADTTAEEGRGIQLMRALVDHVEFTSSPKAGMMVHLEKRLTWGADAVLARLEGTSSTRGPWAADTSTGDATDPQ